MKLHHVPLTTAIYLLPLLTPVLATLPTGFNTSIPSWFFAGELSLDFNLSPACIEAYSASIDCDKSLLMSPNIATKNTTLEKLCTQRCETSLLKYQEDVVAACRNENLVEKNLERTWLGSLVNSTATIPLYFRNCLRDIETQTICTLTPQDYTLAWDVASSDGASRATITTFCANTCLTQNVILNAPTEENLEDLDRMCGASLGIERFPFVQNMVDAGLLREDEKIFRMGGVSDTTTAGMAGPTGEAAESGAGGRRVRWEVVVGGVVAAMLAVTL